MNNPIRQNNPDCLHAMPDNTWTSKGFATDESQPFSASYYESLDQMTSHPASDYAILRCPDIEQYLVQN